MRRLDDALRAAGLHPNLVPDAVKIASLKLLKAAGHGRVPAPEACAEAAGMLAYCMLGDYGFGVENGTARGRALKARLEAALDAGDSFDARLVLLTLHAGLTQNALADRYKLQASIAPE